MSNYRIVRLAGLHGLNAMPLFNQGQADGHTQTYDSLLSSLNDRKILYSNGFSTGMQSLGHDAYEIVWDFEFLQKRWADENGVSYKSEEWQLAIICEQIRRLRPDVIYLQGTELAIPGRFTQQRSNENIATLLKREFDFIRVITMFSGFPTSIDRAVDVDILFSCSPSIQEHYDRLGRQSVLCYHAFDPTVIDSLKQRSEEPYDFTFAGSSRAPESRYWFLRGLLEKSLIVTWLDEPVDLHKARKKRLQMSALLKLAKLNSRKVAKIVIEHLGIQIAKELGRRDWVPSVVRKICAEVVKKQNEEGRKHDRFNHLKGKLPVNTLQEMFPERCRKSVSGLEYFDIIRSSRVSFNRHTDSTGFAIGNMRMFEVTGVGSCLLTDTGQNIKDLFEPDIEVLTYETFEEAVEKYRYVTENETEREKIARRGQLRTLKDHTVYNRCQLIDEIIQKRFN